MKTLCMLFAVSLMLNACGGSQKEFVKLQAISASLKILPLWVTTTGEKSEKELAQLPIVLENKQVVAANANGEIGAVDIDSGKLVWRVATEHAISAGPSIYADFIVIANDRAEIVAYNKANLSEILWSIQLPSLVLAKPIVTDKEVVVQTIGDEIYVLKRSSGEKIWVQGVETPALTLRGTSMPLVLGDKIVAGFSNGKLIAYTRDTGKMIWESSISIATGRTDLERMMDIDGVFSSNKTNIFVVNYQGKISSIDAQSGSIVWSRTMSSYRGVRVDDKQLIVVDAEGYVWSLDNNSGATIWRQEKLLGRELTAPVLMEDTVVVADLKGIVHWLSIVDGDFVARRSVDKEYQLNFVETVTEETEDRDIAITVEPIVSGNKIVVRDNAGTLSAFQVLKKNKVALTQ